MSVQSSAAGPLSPTEELIRESDECLMGTFRRLPVVIAGGQGATVWDTDGRTYIDFVAGIAVNALGHGHPSIVSKIQERAAELIHTSNLYYSEPQVRLAQRLIDLTFDSRIFFGNSGAEANECAIKLARKWGRLFRDGAYEILTIERSFHGRTIATLAATGQSKYSLAFAPALPGFVHVPFGDLDAIRAATSERTVAVMLEPIVGEGGMLPQPEGYLEGLREWCDDRNLLLILDEVQTGVGRTGKWFAYQHSKIEPDILTIAKALGGGIPISACVASPRADVFEQGDHGTTFGGSPFAASIALSLLTTIHDENLLMNVIEQGATLSEGLSAMPLIGAVRGRGLMIGCDLTRPVARELERECLDAGVIVNALNETTLRLVPPLIISSDEIAEGLSRLEVALTKVGAAKQLTRPQPNA
jgi:acetylornithine/N-succinyldiaminopimelate aminotransferase